MMENKVTALKHARLFGDAALSTVLVKDHQIAAILPADELFSADEVIDLAGNFLFPGLIDIHSHGMAGMDTMDGKGLHDLAAAYLAAGITTWLPTTMTEKDENIRRALAQSVAEDYSVAAMPGFHLEGPYISPRKCGAQDPAYAKLPRIEDYEAYPVKLVTLAPELPHSVTFIRAAKERGISVALGHTEADYETCAAAFRAGADNLTHTCNTMPPLLHRDPGPIGAAVMHGAYAQVISDGLHIHPAMILSLFKLFGEERMILISDSMRATGLPDGEYDLGGQPITVKDGAARTHGGALAGSTTTLYACVLRAISFGIPPKAAFAMASSTPATLLGLRKGKIAPTYDADFVVCDKSYALIKAMRL